MAVPGSRWRQKFQQHDQASHCLVSSSQRGRTFCYREFLFFQEVDLLIAATQNTRAGTRNAALAMLLFCQALQPVEISWQSWCDVDLNKKTLQVICNCTPTSGNQALSVNRQHLSIAEVEILKQLQYLSTTDWLLQSERRQRLSERSIHHIIASSWC